MAALTVAGIDKSFGAVRAVAGVSLSFDPGRIHLVAGENGAGKSTLLRIAAGLLKPDAGEVHVGATKLAPHTPRAAAQLGVAMVEQHFSLVGGLTALENFVLGAEPTDAFGRLDVAAARARAARVTAAMGMDTPSSALPWDMAVEDMSVGQRQRLEIARALARGARVLILDEPTAVLAPNEVAALYALLRRMADAGRAVVVVTHRVGEVRAYADRVVVLRHGQVVADRAIAARDDAELGSVVAEVMGRDAVAPVGPRARTRGAVVLALKGVGLGRALADVSLALCAGEIVGIAGVEGNGQRELVRIASGLAAPDRGDLWSGRVATAHADRQTEGLVLDASTADNLVLGELARFSRFGVVDTNALAASAQRRFEAGHVVAAGLGTPVRALSGGNQQKIVLARTLARAPEADVLVLAEPTRGLDPVSAGSVRAAIAAWAGRGKAVLLVSTDLAELRALSDRIVVLARGRAVAELPPDASDASFGHAMLGASAGGAPS